MHKQHGGLWKPVQKLTLLAADKHCWLIGENTERVFCCCSIAQHVDVRNIHIWICGCWAPRGFNAPYKCWFSASWYLTDRAYCEDIKKRLATLYPLVMVQLKAAMRGTCRWGFCLFPQGCQMPTVRDDVLLTQRGPVVLNAESRMS